MVYSYPSIPTFTPCIDQVGSLPLAARVTLSCSQNLDISLPSEKIPPGNLCMDRDRQNSGHQNPAKTLILSVFSEFARIYRGKILLWVYGDIFLEI